MPEAAGRLRAAPRSRALKENVKVIVIGRWRDRPRSYLPDGKLLRGVTVLPDAADYSLLDYPLPPVGKLGSARPVVALRYARLAEVLRRGLNGDAVDPLVGTADTQGTVTVKVSTD
ncbi:hypothetical protein ACGF3G_41080 [Streptomyces sp. NPDC048179]|uniref:hypothetical protein n=1 Tax=Streptomyces sp. NPDC048179 TaxID=3365506 RepID=UPI003710B94C